MENISNRLREERRRLQKNQDDFAALGGVRKGAQVNYENGSRSPDASYLSAIASAGADVQYILTGERSENSLTQDEVEVLTGYRNLDVRGKAGVLSLIGGLKPDARSAVFHGGVGQVVQGDVTTKAGMTFNVGRADKKK